MKSKYTIPAAVINDARRARDVYNRAHKRRAWYEDHPSPCCDLAAARAAEADAMDAVFDAYEPIDCAIHAVEGNRVTARRLTATAPLDALDTIERRLDIPRKDMRGIIATVDVNAQAFPRAYKGRPDSTFFRAVYTAAGWAIEHIYRYHTAPPGRMSDIELTDAAVKALVARARSISRF